MVNKYGIEMKEAAYIKGMKDAGANVKKFPQLHKMVERESCNCRIEYRYNIYEISTQFGKMAVAFHDGINRLQYQANDAKELIEFLVSKGYKTSKKFYMEECGMSEELWNEWNGIGTDEE